MKKNAFELFTHKWDECHEKLLEHIQIIYELQHQIAIEIDRAKKKNLIEEKTTKLEIAKKETGWSLLEGNLNDEIGRLGNQFPSYRYFPEPYYCKDFKRPINLIFVNINPYVGGPSQDIGSSLRDADLYSNNKYSEIIPNYLKKKNPTVEKFFNKRQSWAKSLFQTNMDINILCADIVPWHTEKGNEIANYISKNENLQTIKELVLEPLMSISNIIAAFKGKSMQNKIIVRGVTFRNVINALFPKDKPNLKKKYVKNYIVLKRNGTIEEFISMLTVITINKSSINYKWYLFTGAPSNDLPLLEDNYKVYPINEEGVAIKTLRSFLFE